MVIEINVRDKDIDVSPLDIIVRVRDIKDDKIEYRVQEHLINHIESIVYSVCF